MQRSWCPLLASPTLDYAVYGTRSSWGSLSLHALKVLHIRNFLFASKASKCRSVLGNTFHLYFCESPRVVNMSEGYRQTQLDCTYTPHQP